MKIAVTGAMGFIGHELVDKLLFDGHEVIAVDFCRGLMNTYMAAKYPIMTELFRVLPRCSVIEPWEFLENFDKINADVVVHAGAVVVTRDNGTEELFDKNLKYVEMLTDACDDLGVYLVFISSAAIYGNEGFPNNPYGFTKALGEKIVRKNATGTVSLRLFNVFGRYEHHKGEMASLLWRLNSSLRSGKEFNLHSLDAERDFVPSSSVVLSIVKVIENFDDGRHHVFDVGTGKATSIERLQKMMKDVNPECDAGLLKYGEVPEIFIGKYQMYTCAGKHDAENIGGIITTEEGIGRLYGR